jgi:hypothetical protein
MNLKKIQDSPILPYALIGVGGVAIYFLYKTVRGTTDLFDITKSKEDKQALQEIVKNDNAWSSNYWKSFSGGKVQLINISECERLRKIIVDSVSRVPFMTNDSAILSVFKNLKYKTQVSFFADYFLKKEKVDLLTYIKFGYTFFWGNTGIDDTTSKTIIQYVNNLPSGYTKK